MGVVPPGVNYNCTNSNCILLNARSLNGKLPDFYHLLSQDFAMLFITESWLSADATNELLADNKLFSIYRKDRTIKRGGGVIGLVSARFHSHPVPIPTKFDSVEIVAFSVVTALGSFRFIIVYRPPEYNQQGREYMVLLTECLEFLCQTKDTVLLLGDFNLAHINWNLMDSPEDSISSKFLEFCIHFGLTQFVSEPTHDKNILDLVLSNDQLIISDMSVGTPFSSSDHCAVQFNLLLTPHESCSSDPVCFYDFQHANYDYINAAMIEHPFNRNIVEADSCDNVCFTDSVDIVWDKFTAPLNAAIAAHVPVKVKRHKVTIGKKYKTYPRHISRAIKRKAACWRMYRNDQSVENKNNYKSQAAICKKLLFEYEKSKELAVINKSNIGSFYRFVNNKLSCKSGVGPLRLNSNDVVTDDISKASVLNDYFSSVFTADDGTLPTFNRRVPDNVSLEKIEFSPNVINRAIKSLKNHSNTLDPNGFNSFVLRKLMYSLSNPLCILFNFVFTSGAIPNAWKTANITPIFKSGPSSSVNNYRPISLTSVFCKLYERIVKDQMLRYLIENKLINRSQHGFLARHSTCTQLLETINDWSIALYNRHAVDAVYFDFAKAFDTVSHSKLLHKLSGYGFSGDLFLCIKDFLSNRFQRVVLPNGYSSLKPVFSGVPQGSVLGPLLFLLYINDITDLFNDTVSIKLFADDIKIFLEIIDDSDLQKFQNSIDIVSNWAKIWQLNLSINKCHHMRITLSTAVITNVFLLNNNVLDTCKNCRDLGINVDSHLTFSLHVNTVATRAHLRSCQILRCFLSRDRVSLTKAFVTYVRPLLEYCSPVWSPCNVTNVNKIESVQRQFTKKLKGLFYLSYDERLTLLGLERLELRRIRFDLIMVYKIIHGYVDLIAHEFFTFSTAVNTRGHSYKLAVPNSRINARQNFFSVRIINIWNRLPSDTVNARNLDNFVFCLKHVNLTRELIGKT